MENCVVCGSSKFFLRRKGSAIGLYCSECQKWVKWVGKKDVKMLENRGFKVHSEGYDPSGKGLSHLQPDLGINGGNSPKVVNAELPPFLDEEVKQQQQSKIPCLVCETGFIKSLSDSDSVSANLVETTLVIKERTTGNYLGSFEMNYCPKCGKKVD